MLFVRLWRLIFGVREEPVRSDLFTVKQREIYSYFDGTKVRKADPLPVYRRLKDAAPDLEVEFRVARSEMKNADEHYTKAVERIRKIFLLEPFDNGGLTDMECVALFDHFWKYSGGVKKKAQPVPTPSGGTSESTPQNTNPDTGKMPPTSTTTDFGSIESVSSTNELPPSLSE